MIQTAYQLLHDVATATESCDKLSKVEKCCVSCPPQLVKVIKLSTEEGKASCYLTSALGSPFSSALLQVHLGRGDLPLTTVITLYCLSNLLFADIPYPPDYNVLISWMQK